MCVSVLPFFFTFPLPQGTRKAAAAAAAAKVAAVFARVLELRWCGIQVELQQCLRRVRR